MKRVGQLLGALLLIAGCGSFDYPPASGTWTFYLISTTTPSEPPPTISGSVMAKNSSVTATLTYASNKCFGAQALSFSGTIDTTDDLKLNSATYNNQNIFLTGTLSQDGAFLTSGTYTISPNDTTKPSCAGTDSGTLTGKRTSTSTANAAE